MAGSYVRAVYDFHTSEPGEISLRRGDVVQIVSQIDGSWTCGQLGGRKGNFPSNFVEPIHLPAAASGNKVFAAIENFIAESKGDLGFSRGEIILGLEAVDSNWWKGEKGREIGIFPLTHVKELKTCLQQGNQCQSATGYIAKAVATMDIQAQLDEELSFNKGDIVNIIECEDSIFCKGECKGQFGSFPVDFVEIIEGSISKEKRARSDSGVKLYKTSSVYKDSVDESEDVLNTAENVEQSHTSVAVSKEVAALYNGDANVDENHEDQRSCTPPPSYDQLMLSSQYPQTSGATHPEVSSSYNIHNAIPGSSTHSHTGAFSGSDTDVTPYGTTLFPFIAENPNELTFFDNEIIRLIRHIDSQWIEGELDGKRGIFPTSYIEIIVDCAHSEAEENKDISDSGISLEPVIESDIDEVYGLVLYDYKPEVEGDLSLREGDTVTVIGKYEGWYQAKLDSGETGVCPSNYIEIFGAEPTSAVSFVLSTSAMTETVTHDIQDHRIQDLPTVQLSEIESKQNKDKTPQNEDENVSNKNKPRKPKPALKPKPSFATKAELGKSKSVDAGDTKQNVTAQKSVSAKAEQPKISFNIDANLSLDEIVRNQMSEAKSRSGSSSSSTCSSHEAEVMKKETQASHNVRPKSWVTFEESAKGINVGQSTFYANNEDVPRKLVPKRPPKPTSPVKSLSLPEMPAPPIVAKKAPPRPVGPRPAPAPSNTPLVPANTSLTGCTPRPVPMRPAPKRPTARQSPQRPHTLVTAIMTQQGRPNKAPSDLITFSPPSKQELEISSAIVADLQKRMDEIDNDLQKCKKDKEEMESMLKQVSEPEKQEVQDNIDFFSANIQGLQAELGELNGEIEKVQPHLAAKRIAEQQQQEQLKQQAENEQRFYEEMKQKRAEKREHIINEILETEQDYLRSLQLSIGAFLGPEVKVHPDVDIESLFGNMEEVAEVSQKLLSLLEAGVQGKSFPDQLIGPSFVDLAEELKTAYAPYCRNHDDAIALLEKYEDNAEVSNFFNAKLLPLKQHITVFSLGALLIKPVQRILKYPLLINELIKATEEDHLDKTHLLQAVHSMTDVAAHINEFKRRKDLVHKYKKDTDHSLSDKISKLNIHSIKKKSSRIGQRLSMNLGVAAQTVDDNYNREETKFRNLEKSIRALLKDMEIFLQQVKESVFVQETVANDIADYYGDSSGQEEVKQFCNAHNMITSQIFDKFKYQVEMQVISPVNQLLYMFQAPNLVMKKRSDKLLDYDSISSRLKNLKESEQLKADKDFMVQAKNNYEALNAQLLDDLPKLYELCTELIKDAIGRLVHLQKQFTGAALEQMYQLLGLQLILETKDTKVIEKFNIDHVAAVDRLSDLSFIPKAFNPRVEDKQKEKGKGARSPEYMQEGSGQSDSQKAYLRQKYQANQLWQVTSNFIPSGLMEIPLPAGTLLGVIKEGDPMGNKDRWFVDTGVSQCIIPKKFLSPVDTIPTFSITRQGTIDDDLMDLMDVEPLPDFSEPLTPNPVSPARKSPYDLGEQISPTAVSWDTGSPSSTERSPPPHYTPQSSPQQAPGGGEYYRALYTFAARSPVEISMTEGMIVIVKSKQDQDGNTEWWQVVADGKEGYAPSNYLYKMQ